MSGTGLSIRTLTLARRLSGRGGLRRTGTTGRRRWLGLAILLTAAFMDVLDGNIVNVVVPTIQKDLHATYSDVQWIIAGYTLTCAATFISGGRMGDIFGRRRMFMIGTAGFTAASALCVLAQTPDMLIGARILQGGMTAIMLPQVLAIIHSTFDQRELANVVGLYAAIAGVAIVGGPIIGGLLVTWNPYGLQWRAVFILNLPMGVAALATARSHIEESKPPHPLQLDLVGAFLAALALLLLLYPLAQGRELGWPTWSIASMITSVPLFTVFIAHERRKTRKDGSALIVPGLFRARGYTAGLLVQLLTLCVLSAFFLIWTLYLQTGLGWSPLHTGLTTIPFSLGLSIAGGLSMKLLFPRFGRSSLVASAAMMTAGILIYAWEADHSTWITSWHMIAPLLLIGTGFGQVIVPLTALTLADVPAQDAGTASGMINTISQLGSVLGIALIGTVFFPAVGQETTRSAERALPHMRREMHAAKELPKVAQHQILAGFPACVNGQLSLHAPATVPARCHRSAEGPAADRTRRILATATNEVQREGFARSFQRSLCYIVAALTATLALMFALPKSVNSPTGPDPKDPPNPKT